MSGRLLRGASPLLEGVACSLPFRQAFAAWQRWRHDQSFTVLTYHRIGGEDDPFFPGIAVRDFTEQMTCLARCCRVLPLGELLDRARDRSLPPNAVGISFDDNYASVHEQAWPVMRRLGLPGTVFVPTAPLLDGEPLWYDRVTHALKHTGAARLDAGPAGIGPLRLHDAIARVRSIDALLSRLRRVDESTRDRAVRQLETALRPAAWRHEPALRHGSIEQLRTHAAEGMTIGAHSVSHPIFAGLQPLRVRSELRQSRGQLEGWLQRDVSLFAYPNGRSDDFDEVTERELAEAGYRAAFTTTPGLNDQTWETRRFRLCRIDAAGTAARRLMLRMVAMRLAA